MGCLPLRPKYGSETQSRYVLGLEVLTGVILAYADMPQFMQPTHLVFAIFLFALQIYQVYLVFGKSWVRRRQSLIA